LAALDDSGVVIHISTFSKTLSPGIRIGWVTGSEEIIHSLVVAKQAADLHTSTIQQRATARLLTGFEYDSHIAVLTEVYGERCRTMLDAIETHFPPDARPTKPEGGLFLWVKLPESIDGEELLARALEEQVAFVPGAPFFAADAKRNFIRLNFSNQTPNLIEEGIRRLGRVIKR
ncbi:MAG TPA: PLP-dependent aminotransferase family protein, partial [Blastocatellia bacterium]|nr:PLP-dependent aminotransferase family protein [Blastocatellia bacterium]